MPNKKNDIYCSFCGKHVDHVKKMIEEPGPDHAYICNECIRLTNDILDEDPDYEDDEYKSGNWNPRKFILTTENTPASKRSAGGGMNPLQYELFL